MSSCKNCKYFKFKCLVQIKNKVPADVALGQCTLDGTGHGDMTLGISNACDLYDHNEPKYQRGDVFASRKNVITICGIQREYNPIIGCARISGANGANRRKGWMIITGLCGEI